LYVFDFLNFCARIGVQIQIWILILSLSLGTNGPAFSYLEIGSARARAEETSPTRPPSSGEAEEARALIGMYGALSQGYSPEDNSLIKSLATRTQKFFSDIQAPEKAAALQMPEVKELAARHEKLLNFMRAEQALRNCDEDPNHSYAGSILSAAWEKNKNTPSSTCGTNAMQMDNQVNIGKLGTDLDSVVKNLDKTSRDELNKNPHGQVNTLGKLEDLIYVQSLKNSVETYVTLKNRYRRESPGQVVDRQWVYPVLEELHMDHIRKEVLDHADQVGRAQQSAPSVSFEAASADINQRVDRLNGALKDIPYKIRGVIFKAVDKDEKTKEAFDKYATVYQNEASSGNGLLMLTPSLRDKIGSSHHEGELEGWRPSELEKHKSINAQDAATAVEEAEGAIIKQSVAMTRSMRHDFTESGMNANIEKLITTNPVAVGQVLLTHPEYAGFICKALGQIRIKQKAKKESDEFWGKAFMWGGLIIGGALLLTGVGAIGTAGISAFLGTTGAAAGTTLAATGAALTTAGGMLTTTAAVLGASGTVLGIAGGSYEATQAYNFNQEANELYASVISGNASKTQIADANKAYQDFHRARTSAFIQLGLSALDLGAMSKALNLTDKAVDAASKTELLRKVSTAMKSLEQNQPLMASLSRVLKSANAQTRQNFSKLMGYVSQASEGLRTKLLERLAGKGPAAFQKLIDEALEVVKRNCHDFA